MKKKIILFLIMTILLTSFTYFFHILDGDELWGYGFSYNITKGAIPYKDFNMVILPFYSLIMAIPLKIFVNNLFIFHLFNAIIVSLILTIIDKKGEFNAIILCIYIMIIPTVYSYNCFIMILTILIIYLNSIDYKKKNEIIGMLLGIILMTKQNMGIVLFLPYIYNSKEKLKSLLYFSLVPIIILIYLILNKSLFQCIDYCFLGLSNFNDNFRIQFLLLFPIVLIIILLLINKYRKTKDINYLYLLFFQFINYPLIDFYHLIISIIPIIYYIIKNNPNKYIKHILYIIPILVALRYIEFSVIEQENFLSDQSPYKYRHMTNQLYEYGKNIQSIVNKNKDKSFFIFSDTSYYVKILLNQKITKYDLINKGNMGKDEKNYIKELDNICKNNNCLILLNHEEFEKRGIQLNPIIRNYVESNYEVCPSISDYIYCKRINKD